MNMMETRVAVYGGEGEGKHVNMMKTELVLDTDGDSGEVTCEYDGERVAVYGGEGEGKHENMMETRVAVYDGEGERKHANMMETVSVLETDGDEDE